MTAVTLAPRSLAFEWSDQDVHVRSRDHLGMGVRRMPLDLAALARRRRELAVGIALVAVACVVLVPDLAASGPLSRGAAMVALGAPRFVEETVSAGIDHVYKGGIEYAVGGGIAAFDCNGDRKPDLYLAGGSDSAGLYRNDSPVGGTLRFTRLRDSATDLTGVNGAYPIDIDGDGVVDLVVLRNDENVLLRGLGGCRFERANQTWGFSGGNSATTAFSATWEAGATLPTLAFGRYVNPASSDPHHLCFDNELVRPRVSAHEVRDTPGRGHAVERWVPGVWIALRLSRKVPARGRLEVRLAEHGPRLARNR